MRGEQGAADDWRGEERRGEERRGEGFFTYLPPFLASWTNIIVRDWSMYINCICTDISICPLIFSCLLTWDLDVWMLVN